MFEQLWNSPGFMKLTSNYYDLLFNEARERRVVRVHRREDPRHRARPGDRRATDPEGPSVRREAAAVRQRVLRGVQRPEGVAGRSPGDAHRARHRDRDRDDRRRARVRHHRVGDRLRLRHRRAQPHGDPRSRRARAHGALGRRADHLPRSADPRVPELLLPGRTARGGRQQPALQRRPRRHRHRHARLRDRPRLRRHRGERRGRGAMDPDGRQGRGGAPRSGRSASTSDRTSPGSRGATC